MAAALVILAVVLFLLLILSAYVNTSAKLLADTPRPDPSRVRVIDARPSESGSRQQQGRARNEVFSRENPPQEQWTRAKLLTDQRRRGSGDWHALDRPAVVDDRDRSLDAVQRARLTCQEF